MQRLQRFAAGLREDLAGSGKYRIVYPACDSASCTAAGSDASVLVDSARQAGAKLVIFGGVHKMSTLVQWAKLQALDLQSDKIVFDKLITFRGDNDKSWRQAESFVAREFISTPWPDTPSPRHPGGGHHWRRRDGPAPAGCHGWKSSIPPAAAAAGAGGATRIASAAPQGACSLNL